MAVKKASGPSVDEVVTQAIVKVATSPTPLRLSGKGDPPAVFASSAGVNKEAMARCLAETDPLLRVVGAAKTGPVQLTPAGFRKAISQIPEDRIGHVAREIASGLPPETRAEFLNEVIGRSPAAAAEIIPLYEEAVAAEKAAAEAHVAAAAKKKQAEVETLRAVQRWKDLVEQRRRQRVEALRKELEAEGEMPPPQERATAVLPPPVAPLPRLRPETVDDAGFRRQVARRLVSAWLEAVEANKPEPRQYLETAIWNVSGFRQLGDPGGTVSFDGTYHESDEGISTGAAVRVVRPGWVLEEENDREYVVLPAQVTRRGA
ncbi:MAG: hypothetical protein JWO38_3888 [Gemmataceae bacterium]|nr:hypothetical protein [Gemmataceae bacterium]